MRRIAIAQFDGATVIRVPPLAAGLLASTIRRADLDVEVRVLARRRPIDETAAALAEADLAGLSLYTWNAAYALAAGRRAKTLRPDLVIVAGGPSVPRRDAARFLEANPWLDALVLGEGELAFLEIARAGRPHAGIPGVVVREGTAITLGAPRERTTAFDAIGSPYLDGTFDELRARGEVEPFTAIVLETNRGCPFSCTFCDWGQATQSRVHELPLERIERELAWVGERDVAYLYLVDANFGIRPRDVDITNAIGRIAEQRGSPRFVFFHLTKNATRKNLRTVEILRAHNVATQVALSMQDFDADVLTAIKRDNIRPEEALALREHCHELGLSTVNELMLGLPAQTAASVRRTMVAALTPFASDTFFLYPTRVLENAELADPAYRARYAIETRHVPNHPAAPGDEMHVVEREETVVATASLTIDAWRDAYAFGNLLGAAWNRGLLQTTVRVLRFALAADVAAFIDELLAACAPVRDELARFTRAILDEEASTLPIAGWGPRRRDPADAVCARVFDDPDGFYAAAAEVAGKLAGPVAAEAVTWDALRTSTASHVARFEHDWHAYEAAPTKPPPAQPIIVRATCSPIAEAGDFALEARLHARPTIEQIATPARPVVRDDLAARAISRDDLAARAREDGFAYVPRALPVEAIAALRTVVDAELSARGWLDDGRSDPALRLGRWDDARWHSFLAVVLASPAYRALAAHPALLELMRTVLGAEPELHAGDVCRLVSPGAIDLTTPPHQDAAYLPDAHAVWTAWIPLGDCPLSLGPLAVLERSHRDGLRTHTPISSDGVVGLEMPFGPAWRTADLAEGDVILFSALAVHRALPNLTRDRIRVSVDFRYRPK